MAFELAKNRINLLDIRELDYNKYAVAFEYQYINSDKSRVWQKDILVYDGPVEELHDELSERLPIYVKQARLALEQ